MPSINNDASGHRCFTERYFWDWGLHTCYFWRLFGTNEGMVRDALALISAAAVGKTRCNDAFRGLSHWYLAESGRTFDDVFADPDIWLSYHWPKGDFRGLTSARTSKEITLSQDAFDAGVRAVAATIVHELAHVNGATAWTRAAEDTLQACGFEDQFDPDAVGVNTLDAPPSVRFRRC